MIQKGVMTAISEHDLDKLRPDGKGRQMRVRTGPDEYEAFARAAELMGVNLSTWVRSTLREAAERRLAACGERPRWTI